MKGVNVCLLTDQRVSDEDLVALLWSYEKIRPYIDVYDKYQLMLSSRRTLFRIINRRK
jgi:hypothetical protein